ncbi:putative vitamin h transporter protein [Fonsecaea pedrosoi]|nr:putative vitamin h transporter protein [Fonsecaea pedrosoi]
MWALPDHPSSTRWLSEQEMAIAQERITRDTVEKTESESALQSLKVAFSDPRLYLLALMQNLHLSSAGFNNFFPTVVGTLGFNRTVTLVLTCPPFVFAAIFGPLLALSSGRFNERTWHITGGMAMGVAGFVIAAATLNTAARYVACFLFSAGVYSVNSCILGWVSATLGQTAEKKAISLGFVNIVANASYIYTPYLYPSSDGPRYLPAMGANAGFGAGTVICAWVLKIWLMAENKKLRASSGDGGLAYAY